MRTLKTALALLLGVLLVGGSVRAAISDGDHAAASPPLTLARANQLVQAASSGQYHALRVFEGPHRLTGVVVQIGDTASSTAVVWVTPDDAAVIAGTLFDSTATDLNRTSLEQLGFRYRAAESLRRASLAAARPMLMGSGGPVLTVFIDANCIYCHLLYQQLTPYIENHKMRVRFVMVGVIKADSIGRAAAMLSSPDPLAALKRDQDGFDTGTEEGGFPITGTAHTPAAAGIVTANNALLSKSGIDGTPAFLYCSKSGKNVQQLIGMPRDLPTFLADVSSSPARECTG